MALHELATNAMRFDALSDDKGRAIPSRDIVDGTKPHRLWVHWEEPGGPPVTSPERTGFGSPMIERALAAKFGGTAEIDNRPHSVVLTVEAPLPE